MQQIRTQPAGPNAFRLYSIVPDTYRHDIGERASRDEARSATRLRAWRDRSGPKDQPTIDRDAARRSAESTVRADP